jgi:hypothetical protein
MREFLSLLVTVMLVGGLGYGGYRYISQPTAVSSSSHIGIVLDRSGSLQPDAETDALRGILTGVLADSRNSGGRVFVWSTGGKATALEPEFLFEGEIPSSSRALEAQGEDLNRREHFLLAAVRAAGQPYEETGVSPIRLCVRRGLEQLTSYGCGPGTRCQLFVRTDLEERNEDALVNSLKKGELQQDDFPPPLDNEHINIVFCGLSEVKTEATARNYDERKKGKSKRRPVPMRTAQRADLLHSLWSKSVTHPSQLQVMPFCPKSSPISGRRL